MGREKSKSDTFRIELNSQHQEKSKEELLDEVVDLIIENEKLKKKLRRYENPHTPPSKEVRKNRCNFISKTGLGVGKQTGYKGATRKQKNLLGLSIVLIVFAHNVANITSRKRLNKKSMKKFQIHNQQR